jgi:hypothetical protein
VIFFHELKIEVNIFLVNVSSVGSDCTVSPNVSLDVEVMYVALPPAVDSVQPRSTTAPQDISARNIAASLHADLEILNQYRSSSLRPALGPFILCATWYQAVPPVNQVR